MSLLLEAIRLDSLNNTGVKSTKATQTHTHTHTHTPNTQKKITMEQVSMKISGIPLFKTTSPNLPTPPFIWEKFEHPPFFQKF